MRWKKAAVICMIAVLTGCGTGEGEKPSEETALYEQFLQGGLSAVIGKEYPPEHTYGLYSTYLLNKESYTLEEMEREVADDYLHPKWPGAVYHSEAACKEIQYAYADSMDGGEKNLLLRFDFDEQEVRDLYKNAYDAPGCVVVVMAEENGQLSVIDQYNNGAVFETAAYENGLFCTVWHTGNAAHAILSNGRCERIYLCDELSGEGIRTWKWESSSGCDIYEEVLVSEKELLANKHFSVRITTVYGDGSTAYYYQYDMDECTEDEKRVCDIFVNRCREEASITWVTEEEVRGAVADRCKALGIDFEELSEPVEVVWRSL